jgi:hypothetical protein
MLGYVLSLHVFWIAHHVRGLVSLFLDPKCRGIGTYTAMSCHVILGNDTCPSSQKRDHLIDSLSHTF